MAIVILSRLQEADESLFSKSHCDLMFFYITEHSWSLFFVISLLSCQINFSVKSIYSFFFNENKRRKVFHSQKNCVRVRQMYYTDASSSPIAVLRVTCTKQHFCFFWYVNTLFCFRRVFVYESFLNIFRRLSTDLFTLYTFDNLYLSSVEKLRFYMINSHSSISKDTMNRMRITFHILVFFIFSHASSRTTVF